MALQLSGRVSRVIEREVRPPSAEPFTETTYVVEDWGQTLYVTRARNFDGTVTEGDSLTLAVSVRPYVKKDGAAGFGLVAHRVLNSETEASPKRVASVS